MIVRRTAHASRVPADAAWAGRALRAAFLSSARRHVHLHMADAVLALAFVRLVSLARNA
jgi:hypothetical protein